MTTAAIYARQSIDNAEGVDRQVERCRKMADLREWTVTEVYQDNAVSATKQRGQESKWEKMLNSPAEVVIAVDLDRLLRSQADLLALIESGKKVVTVDGEIDLSTADGEFRATMLAGLARFEVKRKSERQLRANGSRLDRGLPVAGKRRFGFQSGNMLAHPVEAPELVAIFERVRNGTPLYAIAKEKGLSGTTLRDMLTNRAYIGEIPRNTYGPGKNGGKRIVRKEWIPAAPEVARIVPADLFADVQALLEDPARKISPGGQVLYVASGLARCGVCGGRMNSRSENYLCVADLTHPSIRKTILDDVIQAEVFSHILGFEEEEVDLLPLREELAEVARKRAIQQDMATWDGADLVKIRAEVTRLGKRAEELEEELSRIRSAHVAADIVAELRAEIDRLRDDPSMEADEELWDWWVGAWRGLPLETKRELTRRLDIRVHPGRGPERVEVTAKKRA